MHRGPSLHYKSYTANCPEAMLRCIAGFSLPTFVEQCGSSLQYLNCPLPARSVVVHCKTSSAHCPWTL